MTFGDMKFVIGENIVLYGGRQINNDDHDDSS